MPGKNYGDFQINIWLSNCRSDGVMIKTGIFSTIFQTIKMQDNFSDAFIMFWYSYVKPVYSFRITFSVSSGVGIKSPK